MPEFLSYTFMQKAFAGGIIVSLLASYYGVFIVQRQISFLGAGLAHAAFGGIALGLLLNTQPLLVAIPFTIMAALGISWIKNHTELPEDTAVGIFFATSMALGIVFLFLNNNYSANAMTYLFGSIVAITSADISIASVLLLVTLLLFPFWKRWAYATFDRELAEADHLKVKRDDYLLSVMTALTIVISIKLIGMILIAAFLIIPPASARLLSQTFRSMTALSMVIGVFCVVSGLIISFYLDLPGGAVIILVEAIFFGIILLFRRIFN